MSSPHKNPLAVALTPELLREIMSQAASVPVQAMAAMQERFLQSQAERHAIDLEASTQLLHKVSLGNDGDTLRKLREKDPQFHAFSWKSEYFLTWVLECQTRKTQRNLPDAVAVQYAIMAMGDSFRELFPATQIFENWKAFVQALKPKFLLHTAEWSLFLELKQWHADRDWPSFLANVKT